MALMTLATSPEEQLRAEVAELRTRLEEAEDTLHAIRSGEVDALMLETADGPQIFTLQGLDAESNRFRGEILAQVSDSVIAVDADQRVTYLNAAAERQYRVRASDALGRPLSEIYTRRWPCAEAEAATWSALREHGEWRGEIFHRTPDGREIAVDTSLTALRDASGAPAGCVGVFRDITEQERTQEALRESEQRFRIMADGLPLIVWVHDAQGKSQFVNQPFCEYFGVTPQQVAGSNWQPLVHPDDLAAYAGEFSACVRDRRPFHAEVRARRFDGEWRWLESRAQPRFSASGEFLGMVGSSPDITERKQSETNLRESEERTQLAIEATAVGIWEWNVLTNAIRWDAQMFSFYGIPPTANGFVHYSDWSGAVLPEDLPENERILQDTVRRGAQNRREFRIRRRDDGAVRYIESVETVRANAQGETECVVGTNLDVTERKTAEIRLRQAVVALSDADRRKDEFLATLAHELRNPLAPIRNGLQLMKMTGVQSAALEQARSMMERQLTQMVRLIDDLMDVSRISRGNIELRKEHVPFTAVVGSAVEASRPLIERMGHELTVTFPQQPLVVDADMTRLAQVFQNLLNNAAKYSDPGGYIQLNVERQGSDVVVTVKDTGIGIAADQLPRIFEMFTQGDRSLEMSQGGLGIGLTLVKRLVEMHGGRVEAGSEGPGKGSEFVVRLPIVVEASKPQESGGAAEHGVRSSHRILVVDDNRDGADSLAAMLKLMGNDTRTAYDGQEGVDAAGEFRPDVIVLDIGLPKLNGYEACRRIREQPGGKGVVLIAITGWGQDEDRRRSRVAGFDHHMVKPVDPQALMNLLAGLDAGDGRWQ